MTLQRPTPTSRAHTLDPDDWSAFEAAVSKVLRAVLEKYRAAPDGRVWTAPSEDLKNRLRAPAPKRGQSLEKVAESLIEFLPYGVGNTHPRFFGWVHGSGAPGNLLAEIIASAMNANCGGRDHVAIYVERQVITWCKDLFGFPEGASGLVVSGTSMATIIAAKTARDAALNNASRTEGVSQKRLVGYTSSEAHSCLARAFDMIGLGTNALRKVPTGSDFRIDTAALAAQIVADREAGLQPFFLAGTAGTVNTGAIDDLATLAELAERERLWFHVDGAFGACAITSAQLGPRLKGIEQADSLAFDFHKWMHVNYDAGCVLIRDADLHRKAFASRPDYLAANGEALAGGDPWPVDFGPELSRGFRALKVWAHLREHGTDKIGAMIDKNCAQAAYLGERAASEGQLELLAPITFNICCFRYVPSTRPDADLDALNARIVANLQTDGIAAPSTTRIGGQLAIRVNITNHRTSFEDLDVLADAVLRIGSELAETT
ncbi:MAG: pyridoxal-dependent decarboxylase [Hyphomonadaceae bacterium]|nr:pyridoxal-dependent decarboxylase [Hyphomonadaceae bacterium]